MHHFHKLKKKVKLYFSHQARPVKVNPDPTADFTPAPLPPKPKASVAEPTKEPNEDIFDYIFPPKYAPTFTALHCSPF